MSKATAVISATVAIVSVVVLSPMIVPKGDTPETLASTEAALTEALTPSPWITFDRGSLRVGRGATLFRISGPDATMFEVSADASPTEEQLDGIEKLLPSIRKGPPGDSDVLQLVRRTWPTEYADLPDDELSARLARKYAGVQSVRRLAPPWQTTKSLWAGLRPENQEVARRRAMRIYPVDPDSPLGEDETKSTKATMAASNGADTHTPIPWVVESTAGFQVRRLAILAGIAVAAMGLSWAAVAVLVWSWLFLLERIREVSRAVQGK